MPSIHPQRATDDDLEEVLSIITAAFAQDPVVEPRARER